MSTSCGKSDFIVYSIADIPGSKRKPVSVKPDQPMKHAFTLMLQHDFSQLPVMTSERDVKGLVSWKSLCSRLALGKHCEAVRDCMDKHVEEVSLVTSLFVAISKVIEHECVLVRDDTNKVCGIVTTSDLGTKFRDLGEPFLLLGEIETHLRALMEGRFSVTELTTVRDPKESTRSIESQSDLTFGEYLRLLSSAENWDRLSLAIDRTEFIKQLDSIREIRNDVMHFRPDPIQSAALQELRKSAVFLARLRQLA